MKNRRVESGEGKLHEARRDISRHCNRKLLPRKVVPSPGSYPAVAVQPLDNNHRAADCTPSKPRFVGSAAVHQNIHEREDAYPNTQDCEDLRERGVSLFLTWQESFATQSDSNQLRIRLDQ